MQTGTLATETGQAGTEAQLNLLWGSLILEELARLGVRHVCLAPGSRSTPLTLALAGQDKFSRHLHFDERGLGFMALGLAKASQTPVAVITTSGTAVANLLPAVIEASLTRVPLVILSADRPMELLDCGANQAIPQPGLFGVYARQLNLPPPDDRMGPRALLSSLDALLAQQTGPVHINCMYREPLYPDDAGLDLGQALEPYGKELRRWHRDGHPFTRYSQASISSLPSSDALLRFAHGKGVIVVGALTADAQPQQLITLAQKLGWPLLVDGQSQLRQHSAALGNIDQLLLQPRARALLQQADRLLLVGGRLISKRLQAYLAEQDWHSYWQLLPDTDRLDPNHSAKQLWQASICRFTTLSWPRSSAANWALPLVPMNDALHGLFACHIDEGEFGEAQVIRIVATTPFPSAAGQLFIGNSLPIRLYDMYAPVTPEPLPVFSNRGASGIDGLLATCCGIAAHQARPTTLLIGDMSQLHDLNSLALAGKLQSTLVIVVLNNDGGNIFNLLPVPDEALRHDYYRMAHGLNFGYAAAMFGLAYNHAEDLQAFEAAYLDALAYPGASVIEVGIGQTQASAQITALNQWVRQG
ncbi:2-succinyl-5-enolpyruvyl-6-hydroxy-3-cyclohexene-1-carboxylic-acid synthase [Shewanella salipaludis]|uniref:2-succinyl-5-enolpyruvyl-6-hydroxy-3-cyclohexene-1-carboxylate synthase n=1 Tax=Shewanella salipaludis TaxID=2723052 RepID=A0A972G5X2_9GAMM|nr:2-succinyl-5-enolpyruvyl-6-hydroxy-3-cyclohexene-1-carboxylic-acid synthase [Shewanella salipaludis]NMH65055.1 2-succinyl-5-enolpyruvyl-6-hydroxy-3-cyclohexene-1-carboxylic-acid synthase [Shewanella salipaludis]